MPASYAFQAYDTALLIDSAVRAVKGNVADKDSLRAALQKADFKSLRGDSSSTPTTTRSRTSIWPRSPSAPTANRDRDRQNGILELRRLVRQRLSDEVTALR